MRMFFSSASQISQLALSLKALLELRGTAAGALLEHFAQALRTGALRRRFTEALHGALRGPLRTDAQALHSLAWLLTIFNRVIVVHVRRP